MRARLRLQERSMRKSFTYSLYVVALLVVAHFAVHSTHTVEAQSAPQSTSSELEEALLAPLEVPPNCEVTKLYLDDVAFRAHKIEDASLIVIARLGQGEKLPNLNRTRLKFTEAYLSQRFPSTRIVAAERSRVRDFGIVEIYVGGKLLYTLPFKRNARSTCTP